METLTLKVNISAQNFSPKLYKSHPEGTLNESKICKGFKVSDYSLKMGVCDIIFKTYFEAYRNRENICLKNNKVQKYFMLG